MNATAKICGLIVMVDADPGWGAGAFRWWGLLGYLQIPASAGMRSSGRYRGGASPFLPFLLGIRGRSATESVYK